MPQGFDHRLIRPLMDTQSQADFFCQPNFQLVNIRPATILQAMPIQMGWLERSRQNCFNLRPELDFQLREFDLTQKFGDVFDMVKKASLIDQGWHLFPGSERPPPIMDHVADGGQVNTEGNIRMVPEHLHGMQSPGTRNHQGRRTDHAFLERTHNALITRMSPSEIISVDYQ